MTLLLCHVINLSLPLIYVIQIKYQVNVWELNEIGDSWFNIR